ncbi:MAG TPA: hypothetical protein VHJ82_09675 [Actinomycetota bacterium]|nr:hypothetical protein [Actinomycetota bacterium]
MSQPRRRRRRRGRGRGGPPPDQAARQQQQSQQQSQARPEVPRGGGEGGRRRRRRGPAREPASPKSSEDLVRAIPQPRPESLTAPADGTTLEQVIGELQSHWGVPQYPQEYRITIKVADERDARVERAEEPRPAEPSPDGAPRRERAPSAPRVEPPSGVLREQAPRRRRRRRRGRGGAGPSGPAPIS